MEHTLGFALPADYRALVRETNGLEGYVAPGAYVLLWPVSEVPSLNKGYGVSEALSGVTLIGTDGGATGYGFMLRNGRFEYISTPLIGMEPAALSFMSCSLDQLVARIRLDATVPIPACITDAIRAGTWRDPGPKALGRILQSDEKLSLFPTIETMRRVAGQLSEHYVDLAQFCMVRAAQELASPDDCRLVFDRALFIAGSIIPGDDVFVAVENPVSMDARVVILDSDRPPPCRWVPVMGISQFCEAVASSFERR